nr:hypothetical protein [Actinomycetales bacterium]
MPTPTAPLAPMALHTHTGRPGVLEHSALLAATGIRKSFPVDGGAIDVLHGVDLEVADRE